MTPLPAGLLAGGLDSEVGARVTGRGVAAALSPFALTLDFVGARSLVGRGGVAAGSRSAAAARVGVWLAVVAAAAASAGSGVGNAAPTVAARTISV